ncbi:hypothetical protein [Terrihabitans sp. B22-R8]|uniref:hypothetical protein n=1 Tax=Terrihabitans sp. B22-R8 TaxID=3425128 RepID=UPI00403D551C
MADNPIEEGSGKSSIAPKRSRGRTPKTDAEIPLFPTEAHIARLVLGPGQPNYWRGIAGILESHGLPKIDPMMGGRYWPAVKMFFDQWAGIATQPTLPVRDGVENWPVSSRRLVRPGKN